MSAHTYDPALRGNYKEEIDRIRRDFESAGTGRVCIQARAHVVDKLLYQLWAQQPAVSSAPGYALVALVTWSTPP